MVVIVDPHLKRTQAYPVYQEASDLGVLVKPSSGDGEYEGWCWTGSSSWVDFFNPKSWDWWKGLFKTLPKSDSKFSWVDSTENVNIWNDMNEVRIAGRDSRQHCLSAARPSAVCIQWPGNHDAEGQCPLWWLGTPGRPQHQWHALRKLLNDFVALCIL